MTDVRGSTDWLEGCTEYVGHPVSVPRCVRRRSVKPLPRRAVRSAVLFSHRGASEGPLRNIDTGTGVDSTPTRLGLSKLGLMDALDLAKLIDMEAHHRYLMFASQRRHTDGYDAGAFFATMAQNEAKHGQELEARRKALFGDTPARVSGQEEQSASLPERPITIGYGNRMRGRVGLELAARRSP